MGRDGAVNQFEHIVFPREVARRSPVNFTAGLTAPILSESADASLPEDDARFLAWLFLKAGLDVNQYRAETLRRRLNACLRLLRATSSTQARKLLEQNALLLKKALSTMLVGVTSFFRDPHVFEQLGQVLLPELTEQRQGLYAWSIGCSEGPELYSLAILLEEAGQLSKSYLLGTDCREEAIEHARVGCFHKSVLGQVSRERLLHHFVAADSGWQIAAPIRNAVRWRVSNLLTDLEPGLWDLILIRNTAMYLRTESTASLWPRLEAALRPGGILVLGRAERPCGAHRLRAVGPCLYRRHRS